MTVKLLTKQPLEFPNLKGGCTGSPEYTLVKIPHCLKPHVAAHIIIIIHYKKLDLTKLEIDFFKKKKAIFIIGPVKQFFRIKL